MAHVLLVEPNTVLAKTYTAALQHVGHSVAHATGAQAAIDAADKKTPHVVIVELQLPGHSGIEFLHEFRSYAEWLHIPVIINTVMSPAHMLAGRGPLQRDLGVVEILYKPRTSLQDIVRAAREHLQPA